VHKRTSGGRDERRRMGSHQSMRFAADRWRRNSLTEAAALSHADRTPLQHSPLHGIRLHLTRSILTHPLTIHRLIESATFRVALQPVTVGHEPTRIRHAARAC